MLELLPKDVGAFRMQMVGNFSARTSMLALAATFATGIGLATPVAAQDTAAAAESMDEEGGAIVVTARRREEPVRMHPVQKAL